jgi:RNA polymerase sigma factor (sigma-70 family)
MRRRHPPTNHCHVCPPAPKAPGGADVRLLERFLAERDETAFEVLVWRHGPMVLRLCRGILGDAHEAEDAFQATFLKLARKAGSIGKQASLAGWLHTVATRVALRARARRAARAGRERCLDDQSAVGPCDDPTAGLAREELRRLLDGEVRRLPEKHRAVFTLCHLEGKTNEEAAEQLGCPKGTVLSRLSRARERLRRRLSQRGLAAEPREKGRSLFSA